MRLRTTYPEYKLNSGGLTLEVETVKVVFGKAFSAMLFSSNQSTLIGVIPDHHAVTFYSRSVFVCA